MQSKIMMIMYVHLPYYSNSIVLSLLGGINAGGFSENNSKTFNFTLMDFAFQ